MTRAFLSRLLPAIRFRLALFRNRAVRRILAEQIRQLDQRNIVLVSNNCVAGILYDLAGIPKRSPTAGLYFSGPAYGKFLRSLIKTDFAEWKRIRADRLIYRSDQNCWAYPVAGGGEIVFLHYPKREDAALKWLRRLNRMNDCEPFIISSIHGGITLASLQDPLGSIRYQFTVDGDPAPGADELMLIPAFLADLSTYIESRILNCGPAGSSAQRIHRY